MVLNFSWLIEISGAETHPAAKTQSLGLPAYAQLAWVFAEPSGSFIVTPNPAPSIGICPSTGIIPSGSFPVTQNFQPSTGTIPSGSFTVTKNFQPSAGTFIWTKELASVYRDCAKTHASACPPAGGSATKLNRRAVRLSNNLM
jgi:hypothetical protein